MNASYPLLVWVHRVDDVAPGIYVLVRDSARLDRMGGP
jgi:hypothetical protein